MYTQITCPNCQTPYTAEIHQVIDSEATPELKQRLMSGHLNVAVCPNCGAGGQVTTPLLFHDPAHELFMIYMPQELNLGQVEREQLIGQMARQVMDGLPSEKRRAYMLQPQTVISMQTFIEKVLETEGITREMIQRQRNQLELLQTLAKADKDVAAHLIQERKSEIDETFFAMLQQYIDTAGQMNDNSQLIALTNLRAQLMTETEIGRQLEKQQIALHGLNREAKAQNGLSPALLLKHLVKYLGDEKIENTLVRVGQPALNYHFFQLLTEEIDKQEKANNQNSARMLTAMRERLLKTFDAMQAESQRILARAEETLETILAADDKKAAVEASLSQIDDGFMYLLSTRIAQADQNEDTAQAQALNEVHELIIQQAERQYPPEILLLNKLLEAQTEGEQQEILENNQALVSPDLVGVIDALVKEFENAGQEAVNGRLRQVKDLIEARL